MSDCQSSYRRDLGGRLTLTAPQKHAPVVFAIWDIVEADGSSRMRRPARDLLHIDMVILWNVAQEWSV